MAADGTELPANYQENLDSARRYKEIGNARYKNKEYGAAKGQYHRAIIYLKAIDATQKSPLDVGFNSSPVVLPPDKRLEVDLLFADCQSNLAACLLQSDSPSYSRVVDCCKEAIGRVPNNVKAHYRLGVALYNLKRYHDACEALQQAAKLQGKPDGNVQKYMVMCRNAIAEEKQRERERCRAMFAATGDDLVSSTGASGTGVTS